MSSFDVWNDTQMIILSKTPCPAKCNTATRERKKIDT